MREIKFRAWHKDHKLFLIGPIGIGIDFVLERGTISGDAYGLDEVILEQFTGIKSKSGQDIYEGDIMQGPTPEFISVIKWTDHINSMVGFPNLSTWEVIGNIHENGDLLK